MLIFTDYYWRKGEKTEKNQDSLAICQMVVRRRRCLMVLVSDGIGSFEESEKASGFVTEQLIGWFYRLGPKLFHRRRKRRRIVNAVKRELDRVRKRMQEGWGEKKAGATLSMLLLVGRDFYIWNIGDSRIYQKKKEKVTQLTKDDSRKGMLTKCIGTFPGRQFFVSYGRIRKGDAFLVCSDGFYRRLTPADLLAVLRAGSGPACIRPKAILREAAEQNRVRGEGDDVSAVLVRCEKRGYIYGNP